MAMDRLIQNIIEKQNPTVVGLDPKLDYIPKQILDAAFAKEGETLRGAAEAVLAYNKGIIDAVCGIVPAVKPQCAYYEAFGWEGMRVLAETVSYAKGKGMFVILDGKRNDIGSTMEAYAGAHLGIVKVGANEYEPFGGDALTVNGYLGTDGIGPLLGVCAARDRGVFVLVKTSNPSSGELQDRKLEGGETVYEAMAAKCEEWGAGSVGAFGYSAVGAVVGATWPKELAALRRLMPHTMILVPGYGAQGGGASDAAGAFDEKGLGAVVNSSRAALTAWKKKGDDGNRFAECAAEEAIRMREDLKTVLPARIG